MVLWCELLIRSAAVYVIVLMLPLFFAALVWPARRVWAVRAVELLVALILAKFAIVAVLGAGRRRDRAHPDPEHHLDAAGATLVLLAAFSPWALLRLLPLHELAAGAAGGLRATPGTAAGARERPRRRAPPARARDSPPWLTQGPRSAGGARRGRPARGRAGVTGSGAAGDTGSERRGTRRGRGTAPDRARSSTRSGEPFAGSVAAAQPTARPAGAGVGEARRGRGCDRTGPASAAPGMDRCGQARTAPRGHVHLHERRLPAAGPARSRHRAAAPRPRPPPAAHHRRRRAGGRPRPAAAGPGARGRPAVSDRRAATRSVRWSGGASSGRFRPGRPGWSPAARWRRSSCSTLRPRRAARSWPRLLLALALCAAFAPLGGRTVQEWAPVARCSRCAGCAAGGSCPRRRGGHGGARAAGGRSEPSRRYPEPPRALAASGSSGRVPRPADRSAVRASGRRLTAVLACRVLAFSLLDPEAQERRLARWGLVLSGAGATADPPAAVDRAHRARPGRRARPLAPCRARPGRAAAGHADDRVLPGADRQHRARHPGARVLLAVQVDARRVRERGAGAVSRRWSSETERVAQGLEAPR